MTLIEVFSDPAGEYLGTVLVDPERLPFNRYCGLFWWAPAAWELARGLVNR
jgi:hypothetical protein